MNEYHTVGKVKLKDNFSPILLIGWLVLVWVGRPTPPWTSSCHISIFSLGYLTASSDMNRIWYWHTVFATLFISHTFLLCKHSFSILILKTWEKKIMAVTRGGDLGGTWGGPGLSCIGWRAMARKELYLLRRQTTCWALSVNWTSHKVEVWKWKYQRKSVEVKVKVYLLRRQATCWALLFWLTVYWTSHKIEVWKYQIESVTLY